MSVTDYQYAEHAGLLHDEQDTRSDDQRDWESIEQSFLALEAATADACVECGVTGEALCYQMCRSCWESQRTD